MSKGFTLIETIIAIFILIVGTIVIYGVFFDMSKQTNNYPNKLTAFYLAQEGIEIVKNIRHDNWVKNTSLDWLGGIDDENCKNICHFEADYKTGIDGELFRYINEGRFLNINSNNIYSYDTSGSSLPTIYKREIIIAGSNDVFGSSDIFKVDSIVRWQYRGEQFFVQIADFLYNWY